MSVNLKSRGLNKSMRAGIVFKKKNPLFTKKKISQKFFFKTL